MTTPGRVPQTDAQWARDVEARLKTLESSTSARVGGWALNEVNGHIMATKAGQSVNLTQSLPVSEPDRPDRLSRTLTIVGFPTGFVTATFTLIYRGVTTAPIANNAWTAASIKAALVAVFPQYTALDFDVAGNDAATPPGPWVITFPGGDLVAGPTTSSSSTPTVITVT